VTCVLAFGGTATLAALFGLVQSGVRPRLTCVRAWLVDHKDLGGRYLAENVSVGGARQVRMFAVGALAGLAAVGEIRAAEMLMGPFLVLLSGVSQVAVPEAKEVLDRSPERLERFCFWLGLVPAAAAAAWGAAVCVVLPLGLGQFLLADLWEPAAALLVPITGVMILGCFLNAASAGVRALGASRRSLAAQLWNAGLYLVLGSLGAAVGGAAGSSWGLVLAGAIGSLIWWYEVRMAVAEHRAVRAEVVLSGS
jgi:O-antigen/teichoic acid export membrane protein